MTLEQLAIEKAQLAGRTGKYIDRLEHAIRELSLDRQYREQLGEPVDEFLARATAILEEYRDAR